MPRNPEACASFSGDGANSEVVRWHVCVRPKTCFGTIEMRPRWNRRDAGFAELFGRILRSI
jgi:hypothetical protein